MTQLIGAIDQGTTSSRFILFNSLGDIVSIGQKEHEQIFEKPGWVEHDAAEIWRNTEEVIGQALTRANVGKEDMSRPSASRTSAKRHFFGTGIRASRCTMRSSGRTRVSMSS